MKTFHKLSVGLRYIVVAMFAATALPFDLSNATPAQAESGVPLPPSAVLLFWASWCAPCQAEVRDIAELERAAAPLRVVIIPIEPRRQWQPLLRSLRPDQMYLPPEGGMTMLQRLTGGRAALPVSIAVDADGRICAIHYVGVTAALLERWRTICGN